MHTNFPDRRSSPAALNRIRVPSRGSRAILSGLTLGLSLLLLRGVAVAADSSEVVLDFEQATIGKPVPTWTEKGVTFALAGPPRTSKAVGRVMFFPHLATNRKGLLNAMANEQAIPVQARFPAPVSAVSVTFWASTGCPAKLEAFDADDRLLDSAAVEAAPGRKAPADPVPFFTLTVKAPAIAYVRFSGPRNGEFLAADEIRFRPAKAE
jgi:hypothetical protein